MPSKIEIGVASATTSLLGPAFDWSRIFSIHTTNGARSSRSLRGPISLTLNGRVQVGKQVQAIFSGLPDVPINEFTLTLSGGSHGALVNSR